MPQSGYWTTNLIDASLDAGSTRLEFPVSERKVNGGRDWASRKFPFRNGQSDEDVGARPRDLTYVIPLFRDVDEDHYPNAFFDLVEFVESDEAKGRATLTDMEFGPLPVRMTGYAWRTSAKERDGGQLELTFETLGDENFTILTAGGGGTPDDADATAAAAELDSALADAGVTPKDTATTLKQNQVAITEIERLELGLSQTFAANVGLAPGVTFTVPQVPASSEFTTTVTSSTGFAPTTVADDEVRIFTDLTERFQNRIETGDLRSADEIGAELDRMLTRVGSIRDNQDLIKNPDVGWPVFEASSRLMAALQEVGANAFSNTPLVVDYELTRELSALEVAVILFSDPNRVQDVIDLNPGLSPDFFPKGAVLVVPLE